MNTTTTAADVQRTDRQPATHDSRTRTVVLAAACAVVGAAVTAGLVLGLGGSLATAPANSAPAAPGYAAGYAPGGEPVHVRVPDAPSASPAHHAVPTPPAPPAPPKPPAPPGPSAAVSTLQRELGQLNYYEGPVNGIMNSQTTQAITYLQRDAHLPQTGTMNAATEQALVQFLAHGNNQMDS